MPDDAYDPTSLRVLAGLDPPVRDPADPVVRWVDAFLGLPEDTVAPGGVPGVVPEPLGEPRE
jgi:hypothetical protein